MCVCLAVAPFVKRLCVYVYCDFKGGVTYNETNTDPTHSYDVKMRVRKISDCRGPQHWRNTIIDSATMAVGAV